MSPPMLCCVVKIRTAFVSAFLLGTANFLYVVNPFGRFSDAEGHVRHPLLRGSGWLNGTNNMRGLLGPYRGFWSP